MFDRMYSPVVLTQLASISMMAMQDQIAGLEDQLETTANGWPLSPVFDGRDLLGVRLDVLALAVIDVVGEQHLRAEHCRAEQEQLVDADRFDQDIGNP